MLLALFINAMFFAKDDEEAQDKDSNTVSFRIDGMNCNNCKNNVTRAISNLKSVNKVTVNVSKGVATVEGKPTDEEIKSAVEAIGFEFKGRV